MSDAQSLFPDLPEHRKPIYGDDRRVRFAALYAQILSLFVCTDEARYYLTGVGVFPHPHGYGVILVAVSGPQMVVIHDPDGETNGTWICPLPKALLSGIRLPKTASEESAELVARQVHFIGRVAYVTTHAVDGDVRYVGSEHLIATDAPAIEGTFPDFARIVPAVATCGHAGSFLAPLVGGFVKAAEIASKHHGKTLPVHIMGSEPTALHVVLIEGLPEFFGVLMPRHDAIAAELWRPPAWLAEVPLSGKSVDDEGDDDNPVFDRTGMGAAA